MQTNFSHIVPFVRYRFVKHSSSCRQTVRSAGRTPAAIQIHQCSSTAGKACRGAAKESCQGQSQSFGSTILLQNSAVETKLQVSTESGTLSDATIHQLEWSVGKVHREGNTHIDCVGWDEWRGSDNEREEGVFTLFQGRLSNWIVGRMYRVIKVADLVW